MIRKAKPWIISHGTFSWRESDPGEVVPDVYSIVACSLAEAARERDEHLPLLTEHTTIVRLNLTSLTNLLLTQCNPGQRLDHDLSTQRQRSYHPRGREGTWVQRRKQTLQPRVG